MVSELLKMCLPLNRFIARALSVQVLGGSPHERDDILLETKVTLSDVLKVFCNDPNMGPLLDIQRDLCRILLMNTELETMDVLLRVNTLVSYGLEHLTDVEEMPQEIFEFITKVVTEETVRTKILSFLCILSKSLVDCKSNVYLEQLFKLDETLSKILAEKEEDAKLDSLCGLSLLLTEFMVADYPDDNTEWIVQINHLASRSLVEKFEDPNLLFRANNILSQAMRKLDEKPFFGELIELNCILSSVFLMEETKPKYNQLIGWKLLLTVVIQDVLIDENAKYVKKSARQAEKEAAELERLNTKLALVTQERDEIKGKARDMKNQIKEFVKERADFRKEMYGFVTDNINLHSENSWMKRELMKLKQGKTAGKQETIPVVIPDALEEAVPEEGAEKFEEGENLNESVENSEETENFDKLAEKSEEGEKLNESVENSEETENFDKLAEKSEEGEKLNESVENSEETENSDKLAEKSEEDENPMTESEVKTEMSVQ